MGVLESHSSSNLFHEQFRQIKEQQFYAIPNYSYTHQIDPYYGSNYCLMAHKQKPTFEIEKYQLFFNTYEEYENYFEIFQWRNKSKYLVQAKAIKERSNNNMCATFHQATIYVQRIPLRASEITDIPIEQGLYLLYCCFLGFRKIYEKTGYFQITLDMICVNKQAMIKVWLNNNLSKIYPEFYSIDQNFTEADFLYKLLSICQPLIDFGTISQKFSDFLKLCCFRPSKSPKKDDTNKYCHISRFKQPNIAKVYKKQYDSNLNYLSFDRIVQYFEGYLNKYDLVVSRQMKSIKDLFRVQTKIQFTDNLSSNKNQKEKVNSLEEQKQTTKPKIQPLQILKDQTKRKRSNFDRKSTRRINDKFMTERSNDEIRNRIFSYKSEDLSKNISCLKEPDLLFTKRNPPSISFQYRPINSSRYIYQNVYSPQHVGQKKENNRYGRQRIKTVYPSSISFNLKSEKSQISNNLTQIVERQKNMSSLVKKKPIQNLLIQESLNPKRNFEENSEVVKNAPLSKVFNADKNIQLNFFKKTSEKKIVYYDIEKQLGIDEQIVKDLHKFEQNRAVKLKNNNIPILIKQQSQS